MPDPQAIAVVMRLRGAADQARAVVDSLLAQTVYNWELVIVGPGAERAAAAVQDTRVRCLQAQKRGGEEAAALNRAVASTSGSFIAFCDDDAAAVPERLEMQRAFLFGRPQVGCVSGWSEIRSREGTWTRHAFSNAAPDTLLAALLFENPFPFGTVMVNRRCFDAVGGFDEVLRAGADHDLWLRIGSRFGVAAVAAVVCRGVTATGSAGPAERDGDRLSDGPRRDHIRYLIETHPRGRHILEEALSRCVEDDVLWNCHAPFRSGGSPAEGRRRPPAGGAGRRDAAAQATALWLRGLRCWTETTPFNDLAEEHDRRGNPLLAYLSRLRSLAIDGRQPAVFDAAYAAWHDRIPDATRFAPEPAAGAAPACAVSVLIATYNRARLIRDSIDSVLAQTFGDLELVLVDDGSSDNTEEVVRSYDDPRIRYVRAGHRGVAAAFNLAARRARGRYLAYLGDDDVFYPDHLARLVAALETSGAPIVYARQWVVHGHYESGRFVRDFDLGPHGGPYDEARLRRDCIIAPQGLLHRRDCLVAAGGFDERLPCFEDWDLIVRMSERFPIRYVDAITAEYRRHGENMSAGNPFQGRLLQPLLQNYYGSCRGAAILLRAACLQERRTERRRLLSALRPSDLRLAGGASDPPAALTGIRSRNSAGS